ncbi:hypothetical protein [Streptomyces erythrochromogenes]|uniref:hypothetical protein n=1 Tax=Streptomyces erythrochromogenes TaxID=285574 RepID=UPI00131C6A7B|nr:hypothetical protein [Streptomyces erythrochromogenes]
MRRSVQDTRVPEEGGRARYLWPLLAVFAVAVPTVLLVVERRSANLHWVWVALIVLASLAGYAVAVEKIIQERLAESRRRTRMLVWLAATVLYLGLAVTLFQFRPEPALARMTGDLDVAVAGFAAADEKQDEQELRDFATDLAVAAKSQLPSSTGVGNYVAKTGLPLTELNGSDDSELERKTATFADKTDAEIVVGGLARTEPNGPQTHLWPAVYINSDQVTNLPELTGWYVGERMILTSGWTKLRDKKEQLRKELTQQVGALAEFLDATDAWRAGNPAKARQILDGLLDPQRHHLNSFVPSDLVLLFHGAVAEQQAVAATGSSRAKFLETARKDYNRIMAESPTSRPGPRAKARARAALSLQANAYRRAIDPTKLCQPGTVRAADLAQVSLSLKALADDSDLTDLGRLKAVANRAQVEYCRISAGLVTDDGTVDKAVKKLSDAQGVTGVGELRAFTESIAANLAHRAGNIPDAITRIRDAIAHGEDPFQRARWHGWLALWSLELCDMSTESTAHQEALAQFAAANRQHGANPDARTKYEKKIRTEYEKSHAKALISAQKRCPKR